MSLNHRGSLSRRVLFSLGLLTSASGMLTADVAETPPSPSPLSSPGKPMKAQRVIRPASVQLNGSGTGFASVTVPSGVVWAVELVSVSTNVATGVGIPQPVATVFFGATPNPAQFIEETFFGNGDSTDSKYELVGGDSLCVEWTGGTPNSLATMIVRATQREG